MAKYALLDKSGKTRLTTEANTAREAGRNFEGRREAPLPEGWTIVKRKAKPTTKPTAPEFKVGDRVRVKASVAIPKHGWGAVEHGEVGIMRGLDSCGDLIIDFPAQVHWNGVPSEMELAPKKAEPKKLAPGHFTLKMDSGDTLEFWLEQDADGALDLRGCAQGDAVSSYVAAVLPLGILRRYGHIDLPGLKLNAGGQVMM